MYSHQSHTSHTHRCGALVNAAAHAGEASTSCHIRPPRTTPAIPSTRPAPQLHQRSSRAVRLSKHGRTAAISAQICLQRLPPYPCCCRPPGRTCACTQQLSALRLVNMAMRQPQPSNRLGFWPCRHPQSSRTHLASLTYSAPAPAKTSLCGDHIPPRRHVTTCNQRAHPMSWAPLPVPKTTKWRA
jgi:hypothetical protein